MRALYAALVATLVVSACALATRAPEDAGIDVAGMDRTVPPDESFFRHANGGWLAATEIPADRSNWGTFSMVQERTDQRVRDLIEEAASGGSDDPTARKVGDYFASFMDEAAIEQRGAAPLRPQLERIAAIADRKQLAAYLGALLRADVDIFNNTDTYTPNLFGLWVAQDLLEPRRYSPFLYQGGIDMPDREYYLSDAPKMAEARAQFVAHVARVLALAGLDGAEARAQRVAALERKIARAQVARTLSDDVKRGLTHWPAKKFAASAPGLDWKAFFDAAGLSGQQEFVVWHPEAVAGFARLVAK
jgi:putative endopeptidase